jgi:hypothetical protein
MGTQISPIGCTAKGCAHLGTMGLTRLSESLGREFQALRKEYKEHGRYEKPLTWICELFLEDGEQISELTRIDNQ